MYLCNWLMDIIEWICCLPVMGNPEIWKVITFTTTGALNFVYGRILPGSYLEYLCVSLTLYGILHLNCRQTSKRKYYMVTRSTGWTIGLLASPAQKEDLVLLVHTVKWCSVLVIIWQKCCIKFVATCTYLQQNSVYCTIPVCADYIWQLRTAIEPVWFVLSTYVPNVMHGTDPCGLGIV